MLTSSVAGGIGKPSAAWLGRRAWQSREQESPISNLHCSLPGSKGIALDLLADDEEVFVVVDEAAFLEKARRFCRGILRLPGWDVFDMLWRNRDVVRPINAHLKGLAMVHRGFDLADDSLGGGFGITHRRTQEFARSRAQAEIRMAMQSPHGNRNPLAQGAVPDGFGREGFGARAGARATSLEAVQDFA